MGVYSYNILGCPKKKSLKSLHKAIKYPTSTAEPALQVEQNFEAIYDIIENGLIHLVVLYTSSTTKPTSFPCSSIHGPPKKHTDIEPKK